MFPTYFQAAIQLHCKVDFYPVQQICCNIGTSGESGHQIGGKTHCEFIIQSEAAEGLKDFYF